MCAFGPSLIGLHRLLSICCDYADELEVVFNCNKTAGVLFPLKVVNNLQ